MAGPFGYFGQGGKFDFGLFGQGGVFDPNRGKQGGTVQLEAEYDNPYFADPSVYGQQWTDQANAMGLGPSAHPLDLDESGFALPAADVGPNRSRAGGRDKDGRDIPGGAPVPELDINIPIPPWLQESRQELADFYSGRMSPGFSLFSPEQRAALDRQIGSTFATQNRQIMDALASRGISGSGIGPQLQFDAARNAARMKADTLAAIAGEDEMARERAAGALDALRRGDQRGLFDLALLAPQLETEYAGVLGPQILAGPEQQYLDFLSLGQTMLGEQRFNDLWEQAQQQAEIQGRDVLAVMADIVTSGDLGRGDAFKILPILAAYNRAA